MTEQPAARVLIVNSLQDERELYVEFLRAAGFQVAVCADPVLALTKVAEWQPNVVVTRIPQPGFSVNAFELTRGLKQEPLTRHVAVVVIASLVDASYRDAAVHAGCDGYVLLPCYPDELVAEVRRVATSSQPEAGYES